MAKRKKKTATAGHNCMDDLHSLTLTTIEIMSLVSVATHGVQHGYEDGVEILESAVNRILNQADIECEFDDDGVMTLTYNCGGGGK